MCRPRRRANKTRVADIDTTRIDIRERAAKVAETDAQAHNRIRDKFGVSMAGIVAIGTAASLWINF